MYYDVPTHKSAIIPAPRKEVGPLNVYLHKGWRTNTPLLSIYHRDGGYKIDSAELKAGVLGSTVLTFNVGTSKAFRDAVHEHREQLDALLILWR